MGQGSFTSVSGDACAVLGEVVSLLAGRAPVTEALHALCAGLGLRTVTLRGTDGDLLGVAGEALHAVPLMRALPPQDVWLEFPVPGPGPEPLATLTVRGGRPSQLPALRAAAGVLGLALAATTTTREPDVPEDLEGETAGGVSAAELTADRERALDQVADALHDGPLQSLMAARYAADAAVRGGDVGAVREAVQAAVVDLRELVWSVRSRGHDGLLPALHALASTGSGELVVQADGTELDGDAGVLAFRLVQAVRDSGPAVTKVVVSSEGEDRLVTVSGAPLPAASSWALRAAALDARLTTDGACTRLLLPPGQPSAQHRTDSARSEARNPS